MNTSMEELATPEYELPSRWLPEEETMMGLGYLGAGITEGALMLSIIAVGEPGTGDQDISAIQEQPSVSTDEGIAEVGGAELTGITIATAMFLAGTVMVVRGCWRAIRASWS